MLSWRNGLFIVVIALLVRLAFLGILVPQPQDRLTMDSPMYQQMANAMLDTGEYMRYASDGKTLIRETERVPGYALFLGAFVALFGAGALAPVLGQLLLDAGTALLAGLLARELEPRAFFVGGLLAALNLNLITHANLILTETLFLFLFTAHIVTLVRLLRKPGAGMVLLSGLILGAAFMTRPVAMYWVPVFTGLALLAGWRNRRHAGVALQYAVIALVSASVLSLPLYLRNYQDYGHFKLVDQNGVNFLYWYTPLVMSFSSGVSWDEGKQLMNAKLDEEMQRRGLERLPRNPFERSALQEYVGKHELLEQGVPRLAYAWTAGALINTFTPSIASVGYLEKMQRPRFYAAQGDNIIVKLWNFLTHRDNRLYLALMLPALLLTLIFRLLLVFGLVQAWQRASARPAMGLYLLVMAYTYGVTGPLVNASRYRMPMEPLLVAFTAVGLLWIWQRWYKRGSGPQQAE